MPLLAAKLADGLASMELASDVATAANGFASAWEDYFMDASISGVPINGSIAGAKSAMVGVLMGLAAPGSGPAIIAGALALFWTTVIPLGATLWQVPPGVVSLIAPPPGLAAVSGGLTTMFAAHTAAGLSKEASAQAIAGLLHTSAGLGAIATVVTGPTAAPVPIL